MAGKSFHQDLAGTFLSFEGPDGSGKTTVLEGLLPLLKERLNQPVYLTREPGGSDISEAIRSVILTPEFVEMDARTEALLYAASRRQHLVEVILPHLQAGHLVISDRYVDSSLVYQGYARGIGVEDVWEMNQFAIQGLMPDLTIYLDIDASLGLARIEAGKGKRQYDRLDQEALTFHEKVQEGYQRLLEKDDGRIHAIDADRPTEDIVADCLELIEAFYQKNLKET